MKFEGGGGERNSRPCWHIQPVTVGTSSLSLWAQVSLSLLEHPVLQRASRGRYLYLLLEVSLPHLLDVLAGGGL